MDVYKDFEKNVYNVIQEANKEIQRYKHPLNELGISYIKSRHLMQYDNLPTGISLYLPFWLSHAFDINVEIAEKLSLGNFYLTLYVELKDGVIDKRIQDDRSSLLSDRLLIS